jgi:branched-chain amino acid transport system ATP-binding protein
MLKVDRVNAGYGKFNIIREISLEVKDGETVVILGVNGAGKSTLLKVICGLLKPTSGKVLFDNVLINEMEPPDIVELGISVVPEGGQIFPGLSVKDNLRAGAYPKKARKYFKETIEEIFTLFPILQKRKSELAGSLSGGERQMLAVARALMSRPKLILMDELSSGLAPVAVRHVFDHVKQIKGKGYSILMVEQNVLKALELADYAYLLASGSLQHQGTAEEFKKLPDIKLSYLGM